jgi:hypothetical protein
MIDDSENAEQSLNQPRATDDANGDQENVLRNVVHDQSITENDKVARPHKNTVQEEDTSPHAMRAYKTDERGKRQGAWSNEEKQLADQVWNNYVTRNGLDGYQLRCATVNWATVGSIKREMFEAFPERTLKAIRKFCQRRFRPYKNGLWTEEEDKQLREEFTRFPEQWVKMSEILDRDPQAVRDRWRNITQHSETRQTGPWSTDEERRLSEVVDECMEIARKELGEQKTTAETSLSWVTVSKKMGGVRSAKVCREKWENLKRRKQAAVSTIMDEHGPQQSEPTTETGGKEQSRKDQRLDSHFSRLATADIFDALYDIHKAMEGKLDRTFRDESTFWSVVASERPGSKYASYSALRRRAYYGALAKLGHAPNVQAATGIAAKASELMQIVLERMCTIPGQDKRAYRADEFPDGFYRTTVGGGYDARRRRRRKRKELKAKKAARSEELVVEGSEDEDGPLLFDVDMQRTLRAVPPMKIAQLVETTAVDEPSKTKRKETNKEKKKRRDKATIENNVKAETTPVPVVGQVPKTLPPASDQSGLAQHPKKQKKRKPEAIAEPLIAEPNDAEKSKKRKKQKRKRNDTDDLEGIRSQDNEAYETYAPEQEQRNPTSNGGPAPPSKKVKKRMAGTGKDPAAASKCYRSEELIVESDDEIVVAQAVAGAVNTVEEVPKPTESPMKLVDQWTISSMDSQWSAGS